MEGFYRDCMAGAERHELTSRKHGGKRGTPGLDGNSLPGLWRSKRVRGLSTSGVLRVREGLPSLKMTRKRTRSLTFAQDDTRRTNNVVLLTCFGILYTYRFRKSLNWR